MEAPPCTTHEDTRVRCPSPQPQRERERHGIEACPSAPGGRSRGVRRRGRGGLRGAPGSPAALRRPLGGSPGARGGRCPASGGGGRACFQASSPSGRMGLGHLSAAMAGSESPAGGRGGVLRAGGGASSPPVPPAPAPSPSPGGQGRACFHCHPGGGAPGQGRGHPAAGPGGPWPGRPVPGPQGCLLSTVGRQGRGRGTAARTCCWRSMAAPPPSKPEL